MIVCLTAFDFQNDSLCLRSRQNENTQQSGGGAQEIPDYLVPVEPRPPVSPQVTQDYLVPLGQQHHKERLPDIPNISSEYLTPPRAVNQDRAVNQEEDVPLCPTHVVRGEQCSGDVEYQRLHLYETVN